MNMDLVTSIPVRLKNPDSLPQLLSDVRERINRRAYANFVDRGSVHGYDFDDWLEAERELLIKPAADVRVHGEDIFVEMVLPHIDLFNVTVHLAPSQLVIASDVNEDGLQLCQVIDLPVEISLDGVDAEQSDNLVRITAALA
jgi:HSP20 family molecular chaperone IbpA